MTMRDMADLEPALRDLAAHIAYPRAADLSAAVRARIEAAPARRSLRPWSPPGSRRVAAVALGLLAAAVVAAGALALSPAARRAVAGWLGLPGVRIETVRHPPGAGRHPPGAKLGRNLALGRPVALDAVGGAVDFRPLEAAGGALGSPRAYVSDSPPGGRVTFVYPPGPELPRTRVAHVGALLTEFRATLEEVLLKKIVSSGATVEPVAVGAGRGYYISGGDHFIAYIDSAGQVRDETLRLASPTLLWQRDGLILRLESGLSKRAALVVAASLH